MALRSAVTYDQGLVSPTKVAEDYARLQILGCIHALEILNTSASKGSIIALNNYPDLTKQYDYEIDGNRDDLDSIYKFDIVFALDWSGSMNNLGAYPVNKLQSAADLIEATANYIYSTATCSSSYLTGQQIHRTPRLICNRKKRQMAAPLFSLSACFCLTAVTINYPKCQPCFCSTDTG